jgi:Zn-finger in Ran binding protein and others
MMNGSGGYEYTTYCGNSSNTATATVQQQAQHLAPTPAYLPASSSPAGGGPNSSVYDPNAVTQQNAAAHQHQLFMAYIAANYADAHQQQQQQQQQQFQQQNASNVAMAAFLGSPSAFTAAATPNLSPLPYTQQPPSRQPSFEDLLFLQQPVAQSPSMTSSLDSYFPMNVTSHAPDLPNLSNSLVAPAPVLTHHNEAWLEEIQLEVPSISLNPMSGIDVVNRLREKMDDVLTKYIPCVDFLVQCQQDLRKGLDIANTPKRYGGRHSKGMTALQFYNTYVAPLARTFYAKNQGRMEHTALNETYHGVEKLQQDARNSIGQGCEAVKCEAVKSTFLGGMKDGESWGLRKWLSKHGSALTVCTDLECILNACQKLDRSAESTKLLAAMLRPMARQVLNSLKTDIPASYQQHSTAHPYLPFFHRLENALRGMSNFDPEDDDVICLDSDSEDDDVVQVQEVRSSQANFKPPAALTRKRSSLSEIDIDDDDVQYNKRACKVPPAPLVINNSFDDDSSSSGESECEAVIEIIDGKPAGDDWACPSCSMVNAASSTSCLACGEESLLKELVTIPGLEDFFAKAGTPASFDSGFLQQDSGSELNGAPPMGRVPLWPVPLDQPQVIEATACLIAENLDKLANIFDQDQQVAIRPEGLNTGSFWDGEQYGSALRLFARLLRMPEAAHFLEQIDEGRLVQAGNSPLFSHVIKHPIYFRQIAEALLGEELQVSTGNDGSLPVRGLSSWNMWIGKDLLQAIDLVFLNTLAYGNALDQGKSQHRSLTNKIRKVFWNGITAIVKDVDSERRKQCMPTRRSEKSGFVVYKIDES